MIESKLSKPIEFDGLCFKDDIDRTFNIIENTFINKEKRPLYKGTFIFFDMNKKIKSHIDIENEFMLDKPERFYHITSIQPKEYYTMDPCGNDNSILYCSNGCKYGNAIKEYKLLNRVECYYRMSRVKWIEEVLNLANNKDLLIQEWTEVEYHTTRQKRRKIYKRFIRYAHKRDDYIIILEEKRKKEKIHQYRFITAFPLFMRDNKDEYENKYNKYKNKIK